jgi:hypothetical protein
MSTRSRSGSSIWRMTAGASSRLTEGLLSSSGSVATVGLVTATVTLGFAIWFGLELGYQSRVGAPLARSAAVMNGSINESLAALRGWVAYGQIVSKRERARIWTEQIEPAAEDLAALAERSDDPLAIESVRELRGVLRELKLIQWAIEDVAQTPGNRPASVAYALRLEPLRRIILRSLGGAIDQYSMTHEGERAVGVLAQLARFRSAFSEADLVLGDYVMEFDDSLEQSVTEQMQRAREQAKRLRAELDAFSSADVQRVVTFSLEEFHAYDLQVREIIALQKAATWNVAQFLYVREAQPLVLSARAIAGTLAETQARATEARSGTLTNASYVVIAMALLMGLLSGGSLLVSFRLRQQVQNVLQKAKRLGQYEIEKRVGKGGMGEVYLGHHAMLRRPTAIKLLKAGSAQDVRAQARFQREVQLTSQLTHPNTIEIFDYGRTPEGIFYYAMEYVDGFTLESLVALAGPVDPRRVIHTLIAACGSLQEAHDRGLLHRDIKPSNIMLTLRGGVYDTVKILDFGLVKDLSGEGAADEGEDDMIAGTPMYLAPETILTAESGSPRSDLYALGAVAYYLLTGGPIFSGTDVSQILAKQVGELVPFPSERLGRALPEDLEYVVMACLAKDPAERPESAGRLAAMLRACASAAWTDEDARLWWAEYGEAARNIVVAGDDLGSGVGSVGSGIEIVLEDSR